MATTEMINEEQNSLPSQNNKAKYEQIKIEQAQELLNQCSSSHVDEDSSNCENGNANKTLGRWTKEEHQRFVDGLKQFGKNWKKVEEFIGTRSGAQIRSHAQKFFNRLEKEIKKKRGTKKVDEETDDQYEREISNPIAVIHSKIDSGIEEDKESPKFLKLDDSSETLVMCSQVIQKKQAEEKSKLTLKQQRDQKTIEQQQQELLRATISPVQQQQQQQYHQHQQQQQCQQEQQQHQQTLQQFQHLPLLIQDNSVFFQFITQFNQQFQKVELPKLYDLCSLATTEENNSGQVNNNSIDNWTIDLSLEYENNQGEKKLPSLNRSRFQSFRIFEGDQSEEKNLKLQNLRRKTSIDFLEVHKKKKFQADSGNCQQLTKQIGI